MTAREVNFDGLVGPTHNYGGLSLGNVASEGNAGATSSPKSAALQGLAKMRAMVDLGLVQGLLPPHARPHEPTLRRLGFADMAEVAAVHPEMVPQLTSGSAMWAANAATISPSADTSDGRIHFTPANLSANTHRSIEGRQTARTLRAMFSAPEHFVVHDPLPATAAFADEGAANHTRLAPAHEAAGVNLFVYGRTASEPAAAGGAFPRRHTLEASQAIARLHGLDLATCYFVPQTAVAIDGGAFHNDVVAVGNENLLLCHQDAYADAAGLVESLPFEATLVQISGADVSLPDAIGSYLFNSQLLTLPDATMALIAPAEVRDNPATRECVESLVADSDIPISTSVSFDLRQSMRNGGGPACLRLRVVMTPNEIAAVEGNMIVDDALLDTLELWVERHYRDELTPSDLSDPGLAEESNGALDELTQILDIGPLYYFQD